MKTRKLHIDLVNSESGNTSILFLICSISLAVYIYEYKSVVEAFNPIIALSFLIVLAVGIVFSVGSFVHTISTGCRSNRTCRKTIRKELDEIGEFILTANKKISKFESALPSNTIHISSKGLDTLGLARSIVHALEERKNDVERLLVTGDAVDLIDAYELLRAKIQPGKNKLDSVLDCVQVPALEIDNVPSSVNRLIEQVEAETDSKVPHAA